MHHYRTELGHLTKCRITIMLKGMTLLTTESKLNFALLNLSLRPTSINTQQQQEKTAHT